MAVSSKRGTPASRSARWFLIREVPLQAEGGNDTCPERKVSPAYRGAYKKPSSTPIQLVIEELDAVDQILFGFQTPSRNPESQTLEPDP